MNYKAAIFDMDGLLLDTERVCQQAFQEACTHLSLPILNDVYLKIIGTNAASIKEILITGYGPDLDYDTLREQWLKRYHGIVYHQAIPIKKGVIELLTWLREKSIPVAVATSSDRKVAMTKLRLSGLDNYFEHLSTGCEVSNSKPDPEIFLLAASRLDIAPENCLAFEDSNNGVLSAVSAGMIVYQIPDLVTPSLEIKELGHNISDSLSQVLASLKDEFHL